MFFVARYNKHSVPLTAFSGRHYLPFVLKKINITLHEQLLKQT